MKRTTIKTKELMIALLVLSSLTLTGCAPGGEDTSEATSTADNSSVEDTAASEESHTTTLSMDYTTPTGTPYTYDDIVSWAVKLSNYAKFDDLTDNEQATLKEGQDMCRELLTLTTVETQGKTVPQVLAAAITQKSSDSSSTMEDAAIVWCILNRFNKDYSSDLDASRVCTCLAAIVKTDDQFDCNVDGSPAEGTEDLSIDVLIRWTLEKYGYDSGRVLPSKYLYFDTVDGHNKFRAKDTSDGATYWDWSCTNPYESN